MPRRGQPFLSIAQQESAEEGGDPRYPAYLQRVDPLYTLSPHWQALLQSLIV